jgi:hypothetical protein
LSTTTHLSCTCGKVALEVTGEPIIVAECCCTSCREAGGKVAALPGAPEFRTPYGTTPYVLERKDRVRFVKGTEQLREFRLTPTSPTRRVVAACCNTPIFVEFKGGHWLSMYASLWPEEVRPRVELRTMAGDLPDPSVLPADVPNLKSQSGGFFAKLLWAWVAMGFRTPRIATAGELRL